MQKLSLILVLLFYSGAYLKAQTPAVDFTNMYLEVTPDTAESTIEGNVRLHFISGPGVDSIYLNGIKMKYQKVLLNDRQVRYDYDEKGIWLKPEELIDTNIIEIEYSCQPRKGIYFIGWNDASNKSKRQIWTQGQGIDHRHWIPHRDEQWDKLIVDLKVNFDNDYFVGANGVLKQKENISDEIRSWHYSMEKPMSSYLIAIIIGKYMVKDELCEGEIPCKQYFYPEREEDYSWYYYKNQEIFSFLLNEIGVDYPWQNYKQFPVQDFRHGAMENTTATIFGDFFLVDEIAFSDQNYTYVNAHELAHQWFGNLVTARSSEDHWLHEGFATYYHWLSEENLYGETYFDWLRYREAQLVFAASAADTVPLGATGAGSAHYYQKGAWVLHMLRNKLGDGIYRKVIKEYLQKHEFGVVTTDSLMEIINNHYSEDILPWFEKWVYTGGEPGAGVSFEVKDTVVEITLSDGYFPVGEQTFTLQLSNPGGVGYLGDITFYDSISTYNIPYKGSIEMITLNHQMQVLADLSIYIPYPQSLNTYRYYRRGADVYTSLHAVRSIAASSVAGRDSILISILKDEEEFYSIRAEALSHLLTLDNSTELLRYALESNDVQLQKEAIKGVSPGMKELHPLIVRLSTEGKSYDLRENAVHVALLLDPLENEWLKDEAFAKQPGIPGHKVEIVVLGYRSLIFRDNAAQQKLVEYTSEGYDFLTRINAMQTLSALPLRNEELVKNLFSAMFNTNWKLRSEARKLLLVIYESEEGKELVEDYIKDRKRKLKDFEKQIINRTFELNLR